MKIKHLALDQAHKIAAGEVVERPANIVKELLENSLDAGATSIALHIEDGGKQLIRIVDNGCGMSKEDARICFDKHATSKLTSIDQLESITTFGFRGEALASVAAIAQVTLITKEASTHEGIKLTVANSAVQSEEPVAAQTGTDISVADLFYNVPARKKFLKKRDTEWRHIHQLFQAFCLDYPHIHFRLYSEDKLVHNCPPMGNVSDRFASVMDANSSTMIPISAERNDISLSISGVISDHQVMRFDRNSIFCFVNNRWIKNYELVRALLKGYQNVIPQGRYPLACIMITIDPKQVDVNIHPRKEEVKFMHPLVVENLLTMAVKEGLEEQLSRQIKRDVRLAPSQEWQPAFRDTNPFTPLQSTLFGATSDKQGERIDDQISFFDKFNTTLPPSHGLWRTSRYDEMRNEGKMPFERLRANGESEFSPSYEEKRVNTLNPTGNTPPPFALSADSEQSEESVYRRVAADSPSVRGEALEPHINSDSSEYKLGQILVQFNKTYILIEQESGLLMIDQHAAHERILYEQFRTNFEDIATVGLMFPQLIEFARADLELLEPHLEFLNQQGIHVELFSENQLKVTAIPVHLKNASIEELIKDMLSCLNENSQSNQDLAKILHERVHAKMACAAAVKAGDALSHEAMEQLIRDLYKTPNRFSCPHGRPTSWTLPLDEIEKKFKRDYRTY